MRNCLIVIGMLCFCSNTMAQKIARMEYFFDTDPGAGKAISIAITAADTLRTTKDISTQGLSAGAHVLYIRVKNDDGWSIAGSQPIVVQQPAVGIDSAEYFFDTDPGKGNATQLFTGNTKDTLRLTKNFPVNGLQEGFHVFYIRFRDTAGNYSHAESSPFFVTSYAADAGKINAVEYFIDADPGPGKAKPLAPGNAADTIRKTYNIKIAANINTGTHYIGIRVKNATGKWSLYSVDTFTVTAAGLALTASVQEEALKEKDKNNLVVFPNPATDLIQVALKNSSGSMVVTIYDMKGTPLKSFNTTANKILTLRVADLIPGTYTLQTNDGISMQSVKFIKQ